MKKNENLFLFRVATIISIFYAMIFSNFVRAEKYDPMKYEIAWQVMHAIDVMQTLEIQDHPHLKESHLQKIIGRNPDDDNVYAWGVFGAISHYYLMKWVDDNTSWGKTLRRVELSYKFGVIARNHQFGIRISI